MRVGKKGAAGVVTRRSVAFGRWSGVPSARGSLSTKSGWFSSRGLLREGGKNRREGRGGGGGGSTRSPHSYQDEKAARAANEQTS